MRRLCVAALAVTLLAGCASVAPRESFPDVAGAVLERTGARVHWRSGSPADAEVGWAIDALLAEELTAASAVQVALLNNRELQALYEDLAVAQADLVEAGLLRNPVFDAEVRFATAGSGTGVEMALVQDFIDLFFIPLRKARSEAALEAAKLRVAGAVIGLAADVQREFFTYQAAEQMVELHRTVVEATAASAELAGRLREAGNITELDLANERVLHEESRLDLADAEAETARSRERLNSLMGVWGERTAWHAAARLADPAAGGAGAPSWEDLERRAVAASLDLGAAKREIEVAARGVGLASPWAALADAGAGVSAERETHGDWAVGPAVSLPIPLFNQGQPGAARAEAELRRERERYAATAVRVRSRARGAYAAVVAAQDRVEHYRNVLLPLRQTILEQTQLQYNAMQVGPFGLLRAKREQVGTASGYIAALRDYWIARTDLDELVAGRLTEEGGGRGRAGMGSTGRGAAGSVRAQGDH